MLKEGLVEVLDGTDRPTDSVAFSDGSTVLLLPYGGRVWGLCADTGENFVWTGPALERIKNERHTRSTRTRG